MALILSFLLAFPFEVFAQGGGSTAGSTNTTPGAAPAGENVAAREATQPEAATRESVVQDGMVRGSEPVVAMSGAGAMTVSPSGSLIYNYPLSGPGGHLSLTYNSHGGNGLVGMGIQLTGLPMGSIMRVDAGKGIRYISSEDMYAKSPSWDVPTTQADFTRNILDQRLDINKRSNERSTRKNRLQ